MIREAIITTFGLGKMRPAPGTWGSLPPAVLAWLMIADGAPPHVINWVLGAVALIFGLGCIVLGVWAQHRFGEKDPSECVADETCAQCLPLMFWPANCLTACAAPQGACPLCSSWKAALAVGAAFVLFRILDIVKPWPGRRLERLPYGFGVLADDLSSGLYAAIIMQVLLRWVG